MQKCFTRNTYIGIFKLFFVNFSLVLGRSLAIKWFWLYKNSTTACSSFRLAFRRSPAGVESTIGAGSNVSRTSKNILVCSGAYFTTVLWRSASFHQKIQTKMEKESGATFSSPGKSIQALILPGVGMTLNPFVARFPCTIGCTQGYRAGPRDCAC